MKRNARHRIFPWRYGMFLALLATAAPLALVLPWHEAVMAGFDIAAVAFLASVSALLDADAGTMRRNARDNDANRGVMLLLTAIVSFVILVAVGVAVTAHDAPDAATIVLLLATLVIAWIFSNTVYALHYAHICYISEGDTPEAGGIDFPNSDEPNYWDFIYFAFTLGMTFQTSDVSITTTPMRKTVIFHCLAAFIFNLGVIAFTINILGGG
ncbi:MAG: DUF1345 domain-containing protein [Sphingobium sp.]